MGPLPLTRRSLAATLAAPLLTRSAQPAVRIAPFRADATPPLGQPLIWTDPATQILDPLWAKGLVLDDGAQRIVLCAVDWCGLGSSVHRLFTSRIAEAANTSPSRVSVHVVHQHTAPYVDGDGIDLLRKLSKPPLLISAQALDLITGRIAAAVAKACTQLQPVDRIGLAETAVDSVASARRILEDDKLLIRFSTSGKDPKMAALPVGPIDRTLRTLTFARGSQPLARLHYYATHPQTFCCDGRVTADFVGAARERIEREEGLPHIYFTGCSGDVTVGKYNDSTPPARDALAQRLYAALKSSSSSTRYTPMPTLAWKTASLLPPKRTAPLPDLAAMEGRSGQDLYRAAILIAFARRTEPLHLSALHLGPAILLHLPGEPMLHFQNLARREAHSKTVLVAGYGDISPGYLCTEEAFRQGGYEPSASNAGPGLEVGLSKAIRELVAG